MNKSQKNIFYGIFSLLFLLYVIYNYIDFTSNNLIILHIGNMIKYSSIVVCFILALLNSRFAVDKKDSTIVIIALAFTLLSDTLILVFEKNVLGVICFCFVHISYIYRYKPRWVLKISIFSSLLLIFLLLIRVFTQNQYFSFENIFGGLYAFLFILDFVSFLKSDKNNFVIVFVWVGLILFFLCDLNVALFNILSNDTIFYKLASKLMWIFYLPSQVLLALSSKRKVKLF